MIWDVGETVLHGAWQLVSNLKTLGWCKTPNDGVRRLYTINVRIGLSILTILNLLGTTEVWAAVYIDGVASDKCSHRSSMTSGVFSFNCLLELDADVQVEVRIARGANLLSAILNLVVGTVATVLGAVVPIAGHTASFTLCAVADLLTVKN